MKLYICGKVTGDDNYQDKFHAAEFMLKRKGFETVNPARLVPEGMAWDRAMKKCIKAMLDCEGIALLPDWESSSGACIECDLADDLKIPNKPIADWLKGANDD
jgi:hypothetical protein